MKTFSKKAKRGEIIRNFPIPTYKQPQFFFGANITYGKVFVIIFVSDSKIGALLGYKMAWNAQTIFTVTNCILMLHLTSAMIDHISYSHYERKIDRQRKQITNTNHSIMMII
jgi:hypothetical protein